MSTRSPAPAFKPFNLALIQLGQIGADKAANLKHARDMIRKAANGEGTDGNTQGKPDLIVLPVSASPPSIHANDRSKIRLVSPCRSALIRPTDMCTFPFTPSLLGSERARNMMLTPAKARV